MALTPTETLELQRLLAKAKTRPMPHVDMDSDEFSVYDPHTGLFTNPETGEVTDVWSVSEEPTSGAMTDGCKRRDDQSGPVNSKRVMMPQAKVHGGGLPPQASMMPAYAAVNVGVPAPYPDGSGIIDVADTGSVKLPAFPQGITDLAM